MIFETVYTQKEVKTIHVVTNEKETNATIGRAFDAGMRFQLLAKSEGQIGHAIKIGLAFLVDPAKQLLGTETFLSQTFTKSLQAMKIKVQ